MMGCPTPTRNMKLLEVKQFKATKLEKLKESMKQLEQKLEEKEATVEELK